MSEPFVVVAFGDSITESRRVSEPERWTTRLQVRLNAEGRAVRVVNSGVGGHTTTQALERIETDVFAHRPHLVLIEFGFNDCHIVDGDRPRTPIARFERNQREIGTRIRERTNAAIVYIANHPTLIFERKADGFPYEHSSRRYNAVTTRVARELNAPTLDLHTQFGRSGIPLGQLLDPDRIHLTVEGEAECARLVGDFLIASRLIPRLEGDGR